MVAEAVTGNCKAVLGALGVQAVGRADHPPFQCKLFGLWLWLWLFCLWLFWLFGLLGFLGFFGLFFIFLELSNKPQKIENSAKNPTPIK